VFALDKGRKADLRYCLAEYALPFIDYPGQESLGVAKRHNQRLLAESVDGIVVGSGEMFSLWQTAGRPTIRAGYLPAAAIRNRILGADVGGSTCLFATVLYNAALLSGMEIIERYCHSVDLYGDTRYFELGRDASIEYGYMDLRFRNPWREPVLIHIDCGLQGVRVAVQSVRPRWFEVDIEVSEPELTWPSTAIRINPMLPPGVVRKLRDGLQGVVTRTKRTVRVDDGRTWADDLGESRHHAVPGLVEVSANWQVGNRMVDQ
jgi:vancomycin resistance protein YoaR